MRMFRCIHFLHSKDTHVFAKRYVLSKIGTNKLNYELFIEIYFSTDLFFSNNVRKALQNKNGFRS